MTTTAYDCNLSHELARKIAEIKIEIHDTQVLLNNAANIRDARGVGRLQDALDRKVRVKNAWLRKLQANETDPGNLAELLLAHEEAAWDRRQAG